MPTREHDCEHCGHLVPDDDEEMTVWVNGARLRPGQRRDIAPGAAQIEYVFTKRQPGDQEGTTPPDISTAAPWPLDA